MYIFSECGNKITKVKTLIYGSKPNDQLEYPWVVAIYLKINGLYNNICGGSILSETVVLTGWFIRHCVNTH